MRWRCCPRARSRHSSEPAIRSARVRLLAARVALEVAQHLRRSVGDRRPAGRGPPTTARGTVGPGQSGHAAAVVPQLQVLSAPAGVQNLPYDVGNNGLLLHSSFITWFQNCRRQPGKETRPYFRHDAVEIHRCDAGRTSKRLEVRIEGRQLGDDGPNLEDTERTFLPVGSSDDLGQSVTGHVAGSDVHVRRKTWDLEWCCRCRKWRGHTRRSWRPR